MLAKIFDMDESKTYDGLNNADVI